MCFSRFKGLSGENKQADSPCIPPLHVSGSAPHPSLTAREPFAPSIRPQWCFMHEEKHHRGPHWPGDWETQEEALLGGWGLAAPQSLLFEPVSVGCKRGVQEASVPHDGRNKSASEIAMHERQVPVLLNREKGSGRRGKVCFLWIPSFSTLASKRYSAHRCLYSTYVYCCGLNSVPPK